MRLSAESRWAADVTLQDLGSIGEFVAAIATLAYLAIQIRQNTRALRSSTFQEISTDMSLSSEAIATHPELSSLIVKGADGLANLTPEERHRYNLAYLMIFRRLESVYVQRRLGSIEQELTEGFERSALSTIGSGGGAEWWQSAKLAFSTSFVAHVDEKLASGSLPVVHSELQPSPGRPK